MLLEADNINEADGLQFQAWLDFHYLTCGEPSGSGVQPACAVCVPESHRRTGALFGRTSFDRFRAEVVN